MQYPRLLLMTRASMRSEIRETLLLGIPMAGAQLSQLAMTATDVAFVGRLHGEALAALAVGQAAYGFFLAFGIGLIAAVSPLVSQAFGARQAGQLVARPVAIGCWCAILCGLGSWSFLWNIDHLFLWMSYPPEVVEQATAFTRGVMLGLPAFLVFFALKNYLDATSRPRIPLLIALFGIAVNAVADYCLIYGEFGFPALGVLGTGLATSSVNLVVALALIFWVWDRNFTQAFLLPRADDVREYLRIGLPIAGVLVLEIGLFVATALLMGRLGTDEAAAHQIVVTCASSTFMIPLGISFAGAARVGQAVGAGQYERVLPAGLAAVLVGVGAMLLSAVLFVSVPGPIIDLFWNPIDGNRSVRGYAIDLFLIAAIFQIFDGLQVTAGGALRGMKDVRVPLGIAVGSYWLVGLTTACYLGFYTPLRHRGVWIGLLAGLACAGVLLLARFLVLGRRLRQRATSCAPGTDTKDIGKPESRQDASLI